MTETTHRAGETVDIIVVLGHDELGAEVCRGLARAGKRVCAVWESRLQEVELDHALISHVIGDARRDAILTRAGVQRAATIVAMTLDDQLNLRVVLAARDLNPQIRVVLRQFNRWLGRKIVSNLKDSESVSPENFSAATFAASCLNPTVFQAIEFPRYSEHLLTFCRASSEALDCVDRAVGELEAQRRWHVLAIDQHAFPAESTSIPAGAGVTVACLLEHAPKGLPERQPTPRREPGRPRETLWQRLVHRRFDPVLAALFASLFGLLAFATIFFHYKLGLRLFDAFYFVMTTATTTGFGDITLLRADDASKAVGILVMFGGIAITGTLLAYLTATITRRSLEFAQGRHPAAGHGHIVVAGFGNVGARATQYLVSAGHRVVVIERTPNEPLAAEVRAQGVHVMTADATSEPAQDLARVSHAAALLAVTDSDSANLEVALTALTDAPDLPVVMRIADPNTAKQVERHFRIRASYSAAALAAPLITGLAMGEGARGTIDIAGVVCTLAQRKRGAPVGADEVIIADDGEVELVLRKPARG